MPDELAPSTSQQENIKIDLLVKEMKVMEKPKGQMNELVFQGVHDLARRMSGYQ